MRPVFWIGLVITLCGLAIMAYGAWPKKPTSGGASVTVSEYTSTGPGIIEIKVIGDGGPGDQR